MTKTTSIPKVHQSSDRLQSIRAHADAALSVLRTVMLDPRATLSGRIQAARAIIDLTAAEERLVRSEQLAQLDVGYHPWDLEKDLVQQMRTLRQTGTKPPSQ